MVCCCRAVDFGGEILDEVDIGNGVGDHKRRVAQKVETLRDHIASFLPHALEVSRAGIEESAHRGRRRPLVNVGGRALRLPRMKLHAPTHGALRHLEDALLDVL